MTTSTQSTLALTMPRQNRILERSFLSRRFVPVAAALHLPFERILTPLPLAAHDIRCLRLLVGRCSCMHSYRCISLGGPPTTTTANAKLATAASPDLAMCRYD